MVLQSQFGLGKNSAGRGGAGDGAAAGRCGALRGGNCDFFPAITFDQFEAPKAPSHATVLWGLPPPAASFFLLLLLLPPPLSPPSPSPSPSLPPPSLPPPNREGVNIERGAWDV